MNTNIRVIGYVMCLLLGTLGGLIQASSNNLNLDVVNNYVSSKSVSPDKWDLEVDGIYYQITSIDDMTLEIVGGENVYSGHITIPDAIEYRGKQFRVTSIEQECFRNSAVTTVKIGNNISSIGSYAFNGSSITGIEIPSSVRIIDEHSFDDCRDLIEVSFLDGDDLLQFKGKYPYYRPYFVNCPIKSLYIGRDIKAAGAVFEDLSKALEIIIGSTVTRIEYYLLSGASQITSLKIPASVVEINASAFDFCYGLNYVYFEDGKEEINCDASFYGLPIEYLYIGRNFNSRGPDFNQTKINKIDIGEYVTSLISLQNLQELIDITIPKNVENIGVYWGCNNLRTIYCMNPIPPESGFNNVFDNAVFALSTLYVPKGCVEIYKTSNVWHNFFEIKEYDDASSISQISIEDNLGIVGIFDISGHKIMYPQKGLNIIKYSDGTVEKKHY